MFWNVKCHLMSKYSINNNKKNFVREKNNALSLVIHVHVMSYMYTKYKKTNTMYVKFVYSRNAVRIHYCLKLTVF